MGQVGLGTQMTKQAVSGHLVGVVLRGTQEAAGAGALNQAGDPVAGVLEKARSEIWEGKTVERRVEKVPHKGQPLRAVWIPHAGDSGPGGHPMQGCL